MFIAKYQSHKIFPTNIIVDEAGLVGVGILQFIKEKIPYARVYVLGDDL